jgi:hypothetical protein
MPGRGKIINGSIGLERMSRTTWQDRRWMRAALAGAVVLTLALGVGAGPAFAADDDDDTFDTKIFRKFLSGLGLQRDGESNIDYHERSPLVVPPTRTLPAPQSTATAVTNDPAWPKDRDVARKKTVKKKAAIPSEEDDMRQLRPDEMRGTASRGRGNAEAPGVQGPRPEQLTPSQLGHSGFSLGSVFGGRDGKVVQFTGEPARTTLTEPPVGLRTPSSKYPYGSKGVLEADKNTARDQGSYGTDR